MTVNNQNQKHAAGEPVAAAPKLTKKKKGGKRVQKKKKLVPKSNQPVAEARVPVRAPLVRIQRNDPRRRKSQLALLFQTLHTYPVPRALTPGRMTWKSMSCLHDTTSRPKIFARQLQFLSMLANKSPLAAEALKKLSDRTGAVVIREGERGQFGFSLVDLEQGGYTGDVHGENSMHSAGHELQEMSKEERHVVRDEKRNYGGMVRKLEDELLQEEAEANTIAAAYLQNLLQPCETPNIGVPDEENRSLSAKLRVRTLMVAPVSSGKCFLRVSRNPVQHLNVAGAGGAGSVVGPRISNAGTSGQANTWNDEQGDQILKSDSYLVANKRTTLKANLGYDGTAWANDDIGFHQLGSNNPKIDLQSIQIDGKTYDYLPVAPGDTCTVNGQTNDTTVNNHTIGVVWILLTGSTYSVSAPSTSTVTGGATIAGSVTATLTAPANAVGMYEYYIQNNNLGGSTQFAFPSVLATLAIAALPAWYPIGSADLEDLNLLAEHADDLRCVGCRATATYIGEKLEGGWIVGGQLPLPGDFDLPDPTLADVGTLLQMEPKALNDECAGMSFPILPMTKENADYSPLGELYGRTDFGEGIILFQSTSAASDVVILQTEMSLCARTERQTMSVSPGPVSLLALSKAQTFLGRINPLDLVTGNDDHQEVAREVQSEFVREHVTWNILPGWFSGNSAEVRDSNVAV